MGWRFRSVPRRRGAVIIDSSACSIVRLPVLRGHGPEHPPANISLLGSGHCRGSLSKGAWRLGCAAACAGRAATDFSIRLGTRPRSAGYFLAVWPPPPQFPGSQKPEMAQLANVPPTTSWVFSRLQGSAVTWRVQPSCCRSPIVLPGSPLPHGQGLGAVPPSARRWPVPPKARAGCQARPSPLRSNEYGYKVRGQLLPGSFCRPTGTCCRGGGTCCRGKAC